MLDNETTEYIEEKVDYIKKKHGYVGVVILFCAILIIFLSTYMIYKGAIKRGLRVAEKTYYTEKDDAHSDSYDDAFSKFFEKTLLEEQIKTRSVINVQSTNEESKYEVLGIAEQFYAIQSDAIKDQNIRCWEYFTGETEYVIDMQEIEYVVDSEHKYVLVRTKKPIIANERVTEESAEEDRFVFYYKDKKYDRNSFKKDLKNVDFADEILADVKETARLKFSESIRNNPDYEKMAIENTKTLLINLIKSLNPSVPDLLVEVEFID